jgi:lipid II:glycine glycyltransferase (peptidoglycan interpeptide bridge formation enzyme)
MVTLDRRLKHLVRYRLVFFPTPAAVDQLTLHLAPTWMARLFAAEGEVRNGRHVVRHDITATSCVDLSRDLETIFRAMHASTRNKINKAERQIGRITVERNGPHTKAEFLDLYSDLASTKNGQITPVNGAVMDRYSQCSDIFLIYLDGKPLCGHLNLRDKDIGRTRLLFTATRRFVDHETARLGSILNCYLHWKEMQAYKQEGFHTYDLGGLSRDEESQADGIDRFKVAFGGETVEGHNYLCAGMPILGRAAVRLFGTGRNR